MKDIPLLDQSTRQAMVLILVLVILTILSLIGVTFVRLSIVERSISRAYADSIQACLHAQSGIFFATTKIRNSLSKQDLSNGEIGSLKDAFYYGEDLNGNNRLDSAIENQDGDNVLQTYDCLLRSAVRPSYMQDLNQDGQLDENDLIQIRDKKVGVSGLVLSTFGGDFYAVRVEDLSGKIDINMVDHQHLGVILENLAEAAGLSRQVGTKIYQHQPYVTMKELQTKAGLTQAEFDTMKHFLTLYAWRNKKVVQPIPLNERLGQPQLDQYIYAWEKLRPVKIDYPKDRQGKIVGRAPVNVNTALKEVLIALLQGLKGFYLNEEAQLIPISNRYSIAYIQYIYTGKNGSLGVLEETPAIDQTLARQIAESIIHNRDIEPDQQQFNWEGPFKSWQQFNLFCDQVLGQGQGRAPYKGMLSVQQADVLKANFNPNSNINDFNPDLHRMFWVDKTDLTYHTAEFTFHSTGYFSIDSIGRVLGKTRGLLGYQVLAEAEVHTIAKVFDVYQETTQHDFLYEYWHDDIPIKDNIIRGNKGVSGTTNDLSLQTYPEILDEAHVRYAEYDGHISLATIEHQVPTAGFIAHYNQHQLQADTGEFLLVQDTQGPYVDSLVNFLGGDVTDWKPGKLFPDGVYSEIESVPMYKYQPADFNTFAVSMWIKPHFFPEKAAKTRVYMTYQSGQPLGIYNIANTSEVKSVGGYDYWESWDNASFMAGGCGTVSGNSLWEGGVATPCLNHIGHGHDYIERPYAGGQKWGTLFRAGKWFHLAWIHQADPNRTQSYPGDYYNKQSNYDIDILYVNGQRCADLFGTGENDVSSNTANYNSPDNLLRLGERKSAAYLNSAPDATLDEVIVWSDIGQAETEILNIYKEGRYYKVNDLQWCGLFTSRDIDLAMEAFGRPSELPVTLYRAAWTQYVPDSLPPGATCNIKIVDDGRQPLGLDRYLQNPNGDIIADSNGQPVIINEPFRYQVFFHPQTTLNDILIDSLIFDDITIIYSVGLPEFLRWQTVK